MVGTTLARMFYTTYPEKLWGIPPEKMSANWAPKRIELRKKHKAFWAGQYSAAAKYGAGKVMERLAQMAKDNGVRIHLEHRVTDLKTSDYTVTDLIFENGKNICTCGQLLGIHQALLKNYN